MSELKQENILQNRREICFLYDVTDANPNGDPDDSNRPRMDPQGFNLVTDVRLKRTIRDYWLNMNQNPESAGEGMAIIIRRELVTDSTDIKSMENLVIDELGLDHEKLDKKDKTYRGTALKEIIEKLPSTFFDVRAFGAAVTVKGATHQFTGPVQFGLGRSLNKPNIKSMTITTTFASGEEKGAGTFGEYHVVDYSLICFHGIACEYSATKTGFSEDDLINIYKGLWDGTSLLNTRSKFNHIPRLLISVKSKNARFQVGGLDKCLKLNIKENVHGIEEVQLDMSLFLNRLKDFKEEIESIEYKIDKSLNLWNGNTMVEGIEKKDAFEILLKSDEVLKGIKLVKEKW